MSEQSPNYSPKSERRHQHLTPEERSSAIIDAKKDGDSGPSIFIPHMGDAARINISAGPGFCEVESLITGSQNVKLTITFTEQAQIINLIKSLAEGIQVGWQGFKLGG